MNSNFTEEETKIIEKNIIFYVPGKKAGTTVPITFKKELEKHLKFLISQQIRQDVGIHNDNQFVFASSTGINHSAGWAELNHILTEMNVGTKVNATKLRHFMATLMGAQTLSANESSVLYRLFGHDENIHKNVYRCPPAMETILLQNKMVSALSNKSSVEPTTEAVSPSTSSSSKKRDRISRHQQKVIHDECLDDPDYEFSSSDSSSSSTNNQPVVQSKKRLKLSTPEKSVLRKNFKSFIEGKSNTSPRNSTKNIKPLVKRGLFPSLSTLPNTPAKVKKVRETLYNYQRLNINKK